MSDRWNSLERQKRYTFTFTGGLPAITGTLHEIAPDGTLIVAGREVMPNRGVKRHHLNPDLIAYARWEGEA